MAFILGSLPSGQIIAKSRGIDLKKTGSGNIGATNVLRSAGKLPALLTLCGDILKGITSVLIARYFEAGTFYEGIVGMSAVLGHDFSVFLKFKGGKGVATSLGVLSIYSPQIAFFTIIIWIMAVLITRYSSMGALISFGLLPLNIFIFDSKEKLLIAFIMSVTLFIRHKNNISRLINGTEQKIGGKS